MNPIFKKTFPNGVTCVALTTTNDSPLNVSLYFPGGRLYETESNAGITYLLLKMMLSNCRDFLEKTPDLGIRVENHADFAGFSLNTNPQNFLLALKLLYQLVTSPDGNGLKEEKEQSVLQIQKTSQDPLRRPVELFYQSLFAGHPYAFSRYGTAASVKSISKEQIQNWREEVIRLDHLLIVVTGTIPAEKICDDVFEIFGLIPSVKSSSRASVLPMVFARKFTPRVEQTSLERSGIVVGHEGVDAKDHRYYDLEILRNWLAGSRGKLHQSLREKLSIAQTVNAYNVSLLRGGAFFLHAITKPEYEAQLTDYMTAFFSSLGKLIISQEDFEAAKLQAAEYFFDGLQDHDALSYHIASQYMAGKDPMMYWEYKSRIMKVQQSKMTPTIQDIFSKELYAVGIVKGSHEH